VKKGIWRIGVPDADLPKGRLDWRTAGRAAGRAAAHLGKRAKALRRRQARSGAIHRQAPTRKVAAAAPVRRTPHLVAGQQPPGPDPRPLAAYVVDTISVSYHGNNTTHLDSLAHLYFKGQIYNGFPQTSYTDRGRGRTDVMAFKNGIFTRGVLFDIPKLKGCPTWATTNHLSGRPGSLGKESGLSPGERRRHAGAHGPLAAGKEKGPLNLKRGGRPGLLCIVREVGMRDGEVARWARRRAGREAFARGRSEPADSPDRIRRWACRCRHCHLRNGGGRREARRWTFTARKASRL